MVGVRDEISGFDVMADGCIYALCLCSMKKCQTFTLLCKLLFL